VVAVSLKKKKKKKITKKKKKKKNYRTPENQDVIPMRDAGGPPSPRTGATKYDMSKVRLVSPRGTTSPRGPPNLVAEAHAMAAQRAQAQSQQNQAQVGGGSFFSMLVCFFIKTFSL